MGHKVKRAENESTPNSNEDLDTIVVSSKPFILAHGTYETIEVVLTDMRYCLPKRMHTYFDCVHNKNGTVKLRCETGIINVLETELTDKQREYVDMFAITLSKDNPGLGKMLGFDDDQIDQFLPNNTDGNYVADINRGVMSLCIHIHVTYPQVTLGVV